MPVANKFMKIPKWIKKFNGWRTKPEGIIWEEKHNGCITEFHGTIYLFTRLWKQNKWGKWYVYESYGK